MVSEQFLKLWSGWQIWWQEDYRHRQDNVIWSFRCEKKSKHLDAVIYVVPANLLLDSPCYVFHFSFPEASPSTFKAAQHSGIKNTQISTQQMDKLAFKWLASGQLMTVAVCIYGQTNMDDHTPLFLLSSSLLTFTFHNVQIGNMWNNFKRLLRKLISVEI